MSTFERGGGIAEKDLLMYQRLRKLHFIHPTPILFENSFYGKTSIMVGCDAKCVRFLMLMCSRRASPSFNYPHLSHRIIVDGLVEAASFWMNGVNDPVYSMEEKMWVIESLTVLLQFPTGLNPFYIGYRQACGESRSDQIPNLPPNGRIFKIARVKTNP